MPILGLFKKKTPKKSRRSYLIAQIDAIMSKRIRGRDGNRCRRCGRERVFAHHIFTKTRLSTRFVPENLISLCFHCHRWAHSAGEEFREWILSWMNKGEYDQLYLWSQTRGGFKEIDLKLMLWDIRRTNDRDICGD